MKKKPLEYALYLLQMRDRTEAEIRRKMAEKEIDPAEIEKTIAFLRDKDFLDDERFTRNYINQAMLIGRQGSYKIKLKLRQLGIAKEVIDSEFAKHSESMTEYDNAVALGEKWFTKNLQKEKKYEKLGRFLSSRGFQLDDIKRVLECFKERLKD